MNLDAVMTEVTGKLATISGLRVKTRSDQVQTPAGVVGLPDSIDYDATYGRGMDRITLPVAVLVSKVSDRTANKKLAAYADGSGASSVKAALEAGPNVAYDSLRVTRVEFDVITIAAVDYLGATFTLDIAGKGA